MYAPAYGRTPPREGVSFLEEGPVLLVARQYQTESPAAEAVTATPSAGRAHAGEDEDDSLAVVFSANTGAGRAHTPQRLNRTHTPQRLRSSSILHTAAAPVQQCSRGGDTRRQPLGRRKQRRWENDNLLGVEKFLRGRHAHEEGEAEHLTVSHPWRSSLGDLVSDPRAAEVRESIRNGMQPKAQHGAAGGGGSSKAGARRFAGGKWEDAEERFLLVERRLRDIVVRALRNSALLSFLEGLETLLEGFSQGKAAPTDMPPGLRSALVSLPTVEAATKAKTEEGGATLLVPLGPSPFHRLLLHALCQYRKLRSRSEETSHGRIVRVTIPASRTALAVPVATLTEFVIQTRLHTENGSSSSSGGNIVSQASQQCAAATRCGQKAPRAVLSTPVASTA